jgi:hypothetical protein
VIATHLRALALIGFALVGPAALPAGGAYARLPELRRRQRSNEPLTVPLSAALHCAPQRRAPVIARVDAGFPLRLLRRWSTASGQDWLQVELPMQLLDPAAPGRPRRGWVLDTRG